MSTTKKRQPLTREQQATVIQWRPLAIKYTLNALHGLGLGHHEDEATGLAAEALIGAVYVWNPKRGAFASCLKWWVRAVVRVFRAHGARVVHQAEDTKDFLPSFSLNVPVHAAPGNRHPTTWEDLLVSEASDPADTVDSARLSRAAEAHVTRALRDEGGHVSEAAAHLFYDVWLARTTGEDDTPMHLIGWSWGVSRQRAQQRVAQVQAAFEDWARPIREEAA